jgi:hypothetical protein
VNAVLELRRPLDQFRDFRQGFGEALLAGPQARDDEAAAEEEHVGAVLEVDGDDDRPVPLVADRHGPLVVVLGPPVDPAVARAPVDVPVAVPSLDADLVVARLAHGQSETRHRALDRGLLASGARLRLHHRQPLRTRHPTISCSTLFGSHRRACAAA